MTREDTKDADTIDEAFIDEQINPIQWRNEKRRMITCWEES